MLDDQEETGWKYIHGDVFRFPPYRSLFCAFVGTGFQVGPCQLPVSSLQQVVHLLVWGVPGGTLVSVVTALPGDLA